MPFTFRAVVRYGRLQHDQVCVNPRNAEVFRDRKKTPLRCWRELGFDLLWPKDVHCLLHLDTVFIRSQPLRVAGYEMDTLRRRQWLSSMEPESLELKLVGKLEVCFWVQLRHH